MLRCEADESSQLFPEPTIRCPGQPQSGRHRSSPGTGSALELRRRRRAESARDTGVLASWFAHDDGQRVSVIGRIEKLAIGIFPSKTHMSFADGRLLVVAFPLVHHPDAVAILIQVQRGV